MEETRKAKWILIGFLGFAIFMVVIAYFGIQSNNNEQAQIIRQEIAARGGTVQNIIMMPLDQSPFKKSGKGNSIFKITYTKDGKSLTAWYRSDNHSSIIKEKEEWIFNP